MPLLRTTGRALRATLLLASVLGACAAPPREPFEFRRPSMGTEFRLVLYAPDEAVARRAAELAFERIAELDARLSDYRPESELSGLPARSEAASAEAGWVAVSPDLWTVLEHAAEVARTSGGAFDISAGPLVRLWRRARRRGELPSPERLADAARRVSYASIELDPEGRRARVLRPKMELDLGGIAKGYALDEALRVIAAQGVSAALVDGGGDLRVGEPPPGREAWRVALPDGARLELARGAVATSGDTYAFVVIDGVRYSHLVDPRTGRALTEGLSVSVVAPSGMRADAAASAASVLGLAEGAAWIEARAELEARFVPGPGRAAQGISSPGEKGTRRPCVTSGWRGTMTLDPRR